MSEADKLAEALEHAKQVIRVFHDMGLPSEKRDEIWAIYDRASPEMKVINDALAAYQASQSEGEGAEFVLVPREPTEAMLRKCETAVAAYVAEQARELPKRERKDFRRERVPADEKAVVRWKAMLAAAPPPPSAPEWRGIESAPRDGTVIDLWCDGERLAFCHWGDDWMEPAERRWLQRYAEASSDFWAEGEPTHWRPLPAPPKETR